ncbi:hypothetical protein LEP1GSC056_2354 [Leptospira borgpetersenii str. Brem 328]|uniref:Uncharacterized protein n=1 Tax=Leptospira borgpetersenii str. Brem 328 TaxID=1049780 RepID=A0ABC9SGA9_LEPBO|nr:hypothetical protein LEP1GSC056_2354 [Leptospira borgpetersenii str. Brem 328]
MHLFISQARSLLLTFLIGSFETGSKSEFVRTQVEVKCLFLLFAVNFFSIFLSPIASVHFF